MLIQNMPAGLVKPADGSDLVIQTEREGLN